MRLNPINARHLSESSAFASHEIIDGALGKGFILVCDHASNAFPVEYGSLGLPAGELERHIAYDIGAAGVTRGLAARLGVPAVLSCFSRLLIDPNRGSDDPTLVMRLSDGAIIPGNRYVDDDEVARRTALYYTPYHDAINGLIEGALATGIVPAIISIHSFTPAWKGRPRPWHVTVLWDSDPRLVRPMLQSLASEAALVVGENEPYTGELKGDCMYRHATMRGLAHALLEIRQDLIASEAGQQEWADRLSHVVDQFTSDASLMRQLGQIQHFGSKADRYSSGACSLNGGIDARETNAPSQQPGAPDRMGVIISTAIGTRP